MKKSQARAYNSIIPSGRCCGKVRMQHPSRRSIRKVGGRGGREQDKRLNCCNLQVSAGGLVLTRALRPRANGYPIVHRKRWTIQIEHWISQGWWSWGKMNSVDMFIATASLNVRVSITYFRLLSQQQIASLLLNRSASSDDL